MGIRQSIVSLATVVGILAASATSVFAAGNGYAPPGGTSGGAVGGAGFSTVLSAKTVGLTGATMQSTSGRSDVLVIIPRGTFSTPVQVSLTSGNPTSSEIPSGDVVVTAFGVNFSGVTPNKPLTLTITNPGIPANAEVFKITSSGLVQVKATVSNGKVTITFQNDPNFVVVKPHSGYVVGATSPVTGLPFAEELAGGLGSLLLGSALVLMSLRKARTN